MIGDPNRLYSELTYEEQLAYTQDIKQEILNRLLTSGMNDTIPTDKDSVTSMMKVIDGMDRTTLADRKNTIEQDNAGNTQVLLQTLAAFVDQAKNTNPFAAPEADRDIPDVPVEELGTFEHVDGEAEIGTSTEDHASFDARMEEVRKLQLEQEAKELGL